MREREELMDEERLIEGLSSSSSNSVAIRWWVEDTKSIVSQLSALIAKEKAKLDECRDLLAATAAMQEQLNDTTKATINELLPDYAKNNLSSLCYWADHVKFIYTWSSQLHYIDVLDDSCTYNYIRDCRDESGVLGRCASGAITNYTTQLLTYRDSSANRQYNLTQALLFLSHIMGDIHQPLHVGHTSDKGGNTIDVHWYTKKAVLHHVWDDSIIDTAEVDFYNSDITAYIEALKQNITGNWSNLISKWQSCGENTIACPDIYASEGINAACEWAYKDVTNGSVLEDKYFNSRLPVVDLRLAQAGVRLAAILNRIFG